jgi:NADPH-dependent 2,4-dienoyl-CoA reductase/sulfur reductase-like enzyme/nitrite reductase/ring-hydroxylating ferredoxin subunit
MPDADWKKVAKQADLRPGVPVAVQTDEGEVMLVLLGDEVYACGARCTHYGGPLAGGVLTGSVVTCPWHNARFDVKTGAMVKPPALSDVRCCPVKVENGDVFIGPAKKPATPKSRKQGKKTFAIVGAGAAGNAAAETLRKQGFAGRVVLITAEPGLPYDRPPLSKTFLSGDVTAEDIALRYEEFYADLGIELLNNHRVVSLDAKARTLTFEKGETLKFDAALLATGGVPTKPRSAGIEMLGTELPGFFLLRSLGDAQALVAALEKAKSVVVLGTGFIGMELAASLRERGLEVHVVGRAEVPLSRVFGDRIGAWIQGLHVDRGVSFHLGNTIDELRGKGRVEDVLLNDGSRIPADVVVAGLGVVPAVDFLKGTDLVEAGAVPVNERLETKVPGIFAAGDIAVVPDRRTGTSRRIEHWVVAGRMGQHAAGSMLGRKDPYEEPPFFWTRQFGMSVQYVGHASRFDDIAVRGDIESGDFLAGYYEDGVLKAAVGVERGREIIALGEILRTGGGITLDRFSDEGFDLVEFLGREVAPDRT